MPARRNCCCLRGQPSIGGAGSLWGTLIGGIVLALAQTLGAQVHPQGFLIAAMSPS